LTRDAQKRLKVLMEHSDLGSGFQIAMNDLKIRGGGTILGASQSGHIAAVGYEMFLQLMETAVAELRGEPLEETLEPEINVSISAYLSESYIPDIDQRMYAYRRLSRMRDLKEIADFKAELTDRYGALPSEAINLLLKISLKILSQKAGIVRLDMKDGQMLAYFPETSRKSVSGLVDLILAEPARFQMTPENVLSAKLTDPGLTAQIAQAKNLLKDIVRHVNG
jgi:transcription-repair coupling factor (superfamily II helicase)